MRCSKTSWLSNREHTFKIGDLVFPSKVTYGYTIEHGIVIRVGLGTRGTVLEILTFTWHMMPEMVCVYEKDFCNSDHPDD